MAFVGDSADTICAFCLMTSAGVRIAHDTNSATEEAPACTSGVGIRPLGCDDVEGFIWVNKAFVRS